MSDVAGDVFAYGLAAGASPIAFLATVVVLTTRGGTANAVAFFAGFLLAIGAVCVVAALVAGVVVSPELAEALAIALKLALGLVLLAAAWRARPRETAGPDTGVKMQAMLERFDGLSISGAFGAGALLVVLPKRLAITVLAGLTIGIASSGLPAGFGLTVLYALSASVLIWATILVSMLAGERGRVSLRSARGWFVANAGTIVFGASLLFGVLFTGQALVDIAT